MIGPSHWWWVLGIWGRDNRDMVPRLGFANWTPRDQHYGWYVVCLKCPRKGSLAPGPPSDRAVSGPVTCTSWQFMGDPSYFVRMTYTLCVMSTTPRLFLCCLYFYRSPPPGFPDPQHKSPAHSQIATFKATLPRLRFTTRTTCVKCVPHTTLHTLCVTTGLQWSRK